jgi:hypothetical protein
MQPQMKPSLPNMDWHTLRDERVGGAGGDFLHAVSECDAAANTIGSGDRLRQITLSPGPSPGTGRGE